MKKPEKANQAALNPQNFFKMACLFEAALILLAVILGWFANINAFADLSFTESAFFYGLLGTLPLLILFSALYKMNFAAMHKIRQIMLETMGSNMHTLHWVDLAVLAAIAGISEELLFRGVLQPWMENSWGMSAGLILSNILFGLVHAVTPLYALLAALVGIYLGLSLDYGEQRNLLTPVVIHATYDFIAFLAVVHLYRKQQKNSA